MELFYLYFSFQHQRLSLYHNDFLDLCNTHFCVINLLIICVVWEMANVESMYYTVIAHFFESPHKPLYNISFFSHSPHGISLWFLLHNHFLYCFCKVFNKLLCNGACVLEICEVTLPRIMPNWWWFSLLSFFTFLLVTPISFPN